MSEFENIEDDWLESIEHILLTIQTKEQAQEYIRAILNNSTESEIIEYANIYFNYARHVTSRPSLKRKQRGGNIYLKCDDLEDLRIYKLLATMDTIHDVCKYTENGLWKYGVSLKSVLKHTFIELPDGVTEEMLLNEQKVIDFLANETYLQFSNDSVTNPLYDNGINTFDCTRYKRLNSYVKAISKNCEKCNENSRNNYICIIGESESSKKVSAKQILELLRYIKIWFGNVCTFSLDIDHKVDKVFNSLKLINEAWYNVFTDKSIDFPDFKLFMKKVIVSENQWQSYITDAKMFDGMPHQTGLNYDSRPTGWVYRQDASILNICLKGIDSNYRVCFSNTDGIDECMNRNDAEIQHTTNMLFYKTTNIPKAMSYKRAGDWGQVEHCKRYDKIFVTFDRLAALYAYYRKVKFIFIRCIWKKNDNSWVQIAFTISRPT
jgi:hypothetical protein